MSTRYFEWFAYLSGESLEAIRVTPQSRDPYCSLVTASCRFARLIQCSTVQRTIKCTCSLFFPAFLLLLFLLPLLFRFLLLLVKDANRLLHQVTTGYFGALNTSPATPSSSRSSTNPSAAGLVASRDHHRKSYRTSRARPSGWLFLLPAGSYARRSMARCRRGRGRGGGRGGEAGEGESLYYIGTVDI